MFGNNENHEHKYMQKYEYMRLFVAISDNTKVVLDPFSILGCDVY